MKKIKFIILTSFILFGFSSFSQINFGVEGGISSASFTGSEIDRFLTQPKIRPHIGGFAHLKVYRGLALRAGLKYQMKGGGFTYVDTNNIFTGNVDINHRMGYISIPLMIQYDIGGKVKNGFHLNAGINNSFLIHDRFKGSYEYENSDGEMIQKDFPTTLKPHSKEMSFIIGVGLVSAGILFEFNYEQSFSNLYPAMEEAPTVKNSIFNISVGYIF